VQRVCHEALLTHKQSKESNWKIVAWGAEGNARDASEDTMEDEQAREVERSG